jgi:hypothetical protein
METKTLHVIFEENCSLTFNDDELSGVNERDQNMYLAFDYLLIGSLPIYRYGQDFGASARSWA